MTSPKDDPARYHSFDLDAEPERRWWPPTPPQQRLIGFILVLAVVNVAYRLVAATGFQRTAALYVGVPTILAIGLALLPRGKTAISALMKGSSLAMMIACVVLPEGLLCLLFALPLTAIISLVVGAVIDASRHRREDRRQWGALAGVAVPLLILSLEGVVGTPFDPHDQVTAHVVVDASPDAVERAVAAAPDFDTELPTFLTIGFNRPLRSTGSGIAVGDHRTIVFAGGSHDDHPLGLLGLVDGGGAHDQRSEMHLAVAESTPGRVVFSVQHDMTMLSRWVDLDRAIVTWDALPGGRTRVSWTFEYERLLFPTAYFGPLQRYGMSQAAGYLLDAAVVERVG